MRIEVCVQDVRAWDRRLEGWALPGEPACVTVPIRAGLLAVVWVDDTNVPTVRARLEANGKAVHVLPCRDRLSGEYEFEYVDERIVVAIVPPEKE